MYIQTDRQTYRQTDRQTVSQTDRQLLCVRHGLRRRQKMYVSLSVTGQHIAVPNGGHGGKRPIESDDVFLGVLRVAERGVISVEPVVVVVVVGAVAARLPLRGGVSASASFPQ